VRLAERNIGTALNFDRAERYVFLARGLPSAAFFEDDMTLGPRNLDTLLRVLDFAASAASGGKAGYVAAYGQHRAPAGGADARRREVVPVGHAWIYGVRRAYCSRCAKSSIPTARSSRTATTEQVEFKGFDPIGSTPWSPPNAP